MNKRYQVFVSSTFADLREERQEVMQALLELRLIPAGMELFPAANESQWRLIQRVIDDSDYYVVVVGGRYGSLAPEGISYTEKEYRYALEKGKPILGFLHSDPSEIPMRKSEEAFELKEKLTVFRRVVEQRHVKYWDNAKDLGGKLSRSISILIQDSPTVGWVRGDAVLDESQLKEVLNLQKKVRELEDELEATKSSDPSLKLKALSPQAAWILRMAIHPEIFAIQAHGSGRELAFDAQRQGRFVSTARNSHEAARVRHALLELTSAGFMMIDDKDYFITCLIAYNVGLEPLPLSAADQFTLPD